MTDVACDRIAPLSRRVRKAASFLPLLALIAGACAAPSSPPPGVLHVVICWLNDPADPEARRRVIEASRAFERIPGVRRVSAGEPLPSARPLVDDSFDVGILMEFESRQALAAYLRHPEHVRATREVLRPLTARIVVYDIVPRE
jgi:hypothetical protein